MITIIAGAKGSGKTKKIIDAANAAVGMAKGHLIFVTDTTRYMYDIDRNVRFINSSEYQVAGEDALCGFIKGVIAGNNDNEYIFIDGVARIAGKPLDQMAGFFYMLERISEKNDLKVTMTISADVETLPDFIKKYL
ncbi:MAG: hypothetical protein J5993_01995 [Clostridia bacterium]|nr:hypothetical protein [Clostridia bacterium]